MAEPPASASSRKIDEIEGRFEIESEAGSGGMGTVYRARDRTTGQRVALKLLHGGGSNYERFVLESDILSRLSHPAIVGYVAHGETERGPYLAMEWLEGETLHDHLRSGPLGVGELVSLGRRVADALAAAHAAGVVHRDLKPSNLFLPAGRIADVKVLDFGVARLREDDRELTLTNQIVGTPGYMAPEQARGLREIDQRADLFALGCVLFRALTGTPAFDGTDVLSVLAKLVVHEPPPVGELVADVPEELEQLIVCLLEKSPADRPPSADAVRDELSRIADLIEKAGPHLRRPKRVASQSEPTLACVVLARPTLELPAPALSPEAFADLSEAITVAGGRLQKLAGGALLVDVEDRGSPEDQAGRAARCAGVLSSSAQDLRVSIASGVGPLSGPSSEKAELVLHRHLLRALGDLGLPLGLANTVLAVPGAAHETSATPGPISGTLSERRASSPRRRFVAAALVAAGSAAAVALVFSMMRARDEAASPPVTATAKSAPVIIVSAPPLEPKPLEARVRVSPSGAQVLVNGRPARLDGDELVLRGKPGEGFDVLVESGARSATRRVLIARDGTASPASIEIAAPSRATKRALPEPAPSAAKPEQKAPAPTSSAGPARESWD